MLRRTGRLMSRRAGVPGFTGPFDTLSTTFDGLTQWLQLQSDYQFDNVNPFTFIWWLKSSVVLTGSQWLYGNLNSAASGLPGIRIGILTPGSLFINLRGSVGTIIVTADLRPVIANDTWFQLAVRYDGSGLAAGLGALVDQVAVPTSVVLDALSGSIAGGGTGYLFAEYDHNGPWSGNGDEVTVWGAALSDGQVGETAVLGKPVDPMQLSIADLLIAEYRMGEDPDSELLIPNRVNPGTYDAVPAGMTAANFVADVP